MGERIFFQKDLNKSSEQGTEKATVAFRRGSPYEACSTTLISVYDPLGLLANVLMFLKVLVLCRFNIVSDEPIAGQQLSKWRAWLSVLHNVEKVSVPRCYRTITTSLSVIQLHVFIDASENGYATVAYFRYVRSIPRLELQAAVIGMRLAKAIGETHRIPVQKRIFWIDSRDILCWLRSDHRKHSKFVCARVGEILENTDLSKWFWIPTKLNVADDGTKWQRIPDLSPSRRWFRGSMFLWQPRRAWPTQPANVNVHEVRVPIIVFTNYSNWRKLVRVVAYMLRIFRNTQAKLQYRTPTTGILNQQELLDAEHCLYKQAKLDQYSKEIALLSGFKKVAGVKADPIPKDSSIYKLSPFLDEKGVLHMLGRSAGCKLIQPTAAHTILLLKKHTLTTLIVRFYHERYYHLKHKTVVNELRQKYRIPKM
ncbi:uncharacterized protein LOC131693709 [Topomyia yanbarensis]|uniref:uncharacterized protein LOC131693709 n=1 Tax=Topomyia yanbarensis TaxID=2498891 RepID=UPI00273CAC92|nr:uncharacterized protein LOC131693709 [Topomyia yanbarensis]